MLQFSSACNCPHVSDEAKRDKYRGLQDTVVDCGWVGAEVSDSDTPVGVCSKNCTGFGVKPALAVQLSSSSINTSANSTKSPQSTVAANHAFQ